MATNFQPVAAVLGLLLTAACKKAPTDDPTTVVPTVRTCLLSSFIPSGNYRTVFVYNTDGKLARYRVFSNGPYYPPLTRILEYDGAKRLTRIADSVGVGQPQQTNADFSGYTPGGDPQRAVYRTGTVKEAEMEFIYDVNQNLVKKVLLFFSANGTPFPQRDTLRYYYDSRNNLSKETAITRLNGVRREYILLEAEGYDSKPNFYRSLGKEFNFLYRFNRAGEGFLNLGDYLYSPTANNPARVYLHNQGTNDANRGDFFSYSYEYDPDTGYPSKVTYMYTSNGVTRGPGEHVVRYNCR